MRASSAGSTAIAATLDNAEAARWATTLVLMAKPQDMETLLAQVRPHVTPEDLVISFAAGIRTSFVEKHLPEDVPVVRVMSNVPVMVDEAMSVVTGGRFADRRASGRAPRSCSGTWARCSD